MMSKKINAERREQLIQDILAAQQDLVALGERHGLSADDLAGWVAEPETQKTLGGLCLLADLQTQILLSRYRLVAAGRLIRLAAEDGSSDSREVARRACVDLLKLDLKRVDAMGAESGGLDGVDEEVAGGVGAALRRLLYGGEETTDRPTEEGVEGGEN